jgi:hypothetical protein
MSVTDTSVEHREAIRAHYQAGKLEGERRLGLIEGSDSFQSQRRDLEEQTAAQLVDIDGLEENFLQGVWHVVGTTVPLSFYNHVNVQSKILGASYITLSNGETNV